MDDIQQKIDELGPWHYAMMIKGHPTGDSQVESIHPKLVQLLNAGAFQRKVYKRVLDLGANSGLLSMYFADHKGSIVDAIEGGVKFYPQLEFAVEQKGYTGKVIPIRGDITNYQFLENEYDLVLYLGTMHHLKPEFHKPVLEKCLKALVPSGEIVIQTKSDLPVENLMKEVGFLGVKKLNTNWEDRSAWFGFKDAMKV